MVKIKHTFADSDVKSVLTTQALPGVVGVKNTQTVIEVSIDNPNGCGWFTEADLLVMLSMIRSSQSEATS